MSNIGSKQQTRKVIFQYADVANRFKQDQQAKVEANIKVNASVLSKIPHALENTTNVDQTQIQNIWNDDDLICRQQESDPTEDARSAEFDGNNQTSVTELMAPEAQRERFMTQDPSEMSLGMPHKEQNMSDKSLERCDNKD